MGRGVNAGGGGRGAGQHLAPRRCARALFPSPRQRSEWRGGGAGGGGGGGAARARRPAGASGPGAAQLAPSKCSPPTPSAFASRTRPTLPANGREGGRVGRQGVQCRARVFKSAG